MKSEKWLETKDFLVFHPPSAAAAGALVGKKARPLPTSRSAGAREAPGSGQGGRASTGGSAEGGLKGG